MDDEREKVQQQMKSITTTGRRVEETLTALAQKTGRKEDIEAARRIDAAVTGLDQALEELRSTQDD